MTIFDCQPAFNVGAPRSSEKVGEGGTELICQHLSSFINWDCTMIASLALRSACQGQMLSSKKTWRQTGLCSQRWAHHLRHSLCLLFPLLPPPTHTTLIFYWSKGAKKTASRDRHHCFKLWLCPLLAMHTWTRNLPFVVLVLHQTIQWGLGCCTGLKSSFLSMVEHLEVLPFFCSSLFCQPSLNYSEQTAIIKFCQLRDSHNEWMRYSATLLKGVKPKITMSLRWVLC